MQEITLSTQDIAIGEDPKNEPMKSKSKKPIIPNLKAAATINTHAIVLNIIHFLN